MSNTPNHTELKAGPDMPNSEVYVALFREKLSQC